VRSLRGLAAKPQSRCFWAPALAACVTLSGRLVYTFQLAAIAAGSIARARTQRSRSTTFSLRLRDEVDLDTVRTALIDAVRETVQPVHARVWIRRCIALETVCG
jgi:ABC-type transporter Mla maintaining outer membrane lipid asymmetry permease subunit MlaE